MPSAAKNWDQHVVDAEELARTPAFQAIRDRIVALAAAGPDDVVVDVGAGTGLLTLALAPVVKTVWAIDVAPAMTEYLAVKAASGELRNVEAATATAVSLPLVDGAATLVVSNYCYHHLDDADKQRALREAFRVLSPGGRIVFADMMFRVQISGSRNRHVIVEKIGALLRRGPAGVLRLLKNLVRFAARRWEQPADAQWWRHALKRAGFASIEVQLLDHEGGIVTARRPVSARGAAGRRRRSIRAAA